MNLAEMLTFADIEQLNRIARHYQCECSQHSKNDLIQSIMLRLSSAAAWEEICSGLMPEMYKFLQLLTFDGREHYSLEELMGKAKHSIGAAEDITPRMVIIEAVQRGWLFSGVKHNTRQLYYVPHDLKSDWSRRIGTYQKDNCLTMTEEPPWYRDESLLLADDLITMLKFVQQEMLQLTGDGSIYKRQQLMLFERLATREKPIERGGWRFGFGFRYAQYPDRFSLLYDYALHFRFMDETPDGWLTISDHGRNKLATFIPQHEAKELYSFWARLYRRPIPMLPYILKNMLASAGDGWVTLASMKALMNLWLAPYYYETVDSLFEQRIVNMLVSLGILKKGSFDETEVISFTKAGQQWIQGNNENLQEIDFSEFKQVKKHRKTNIH